jgi:hypothetical protein
MTTTSLTRVYQHSLENPVENWIKSIILKIKATDELDRSELKRLNSDLRAYLDHVRALENLNRKLIVDVENARVKSVPAIMDKSQYEKELDALRLKLSQHSFSAVSSQVAIEESTKLSQSLSELIKFFVHESDLQRQKITVLQNTLAEIVRQREAIARNFKSVDDEVKNARIGFSHAERDLENARAQLKDAKLRHKRVLLDRNALRDELEFRKALNEIERGDLTNGYSYDVRTVDVGFYANELQNAIAQIKQDFHNLSQRQLEEYKKSKENELAIRNQEYEYEKRLAEAAIARSIAEQNTEIGNSNELRLSYSRNQAELEQLSIRHNELLSRLKHLENKIEENRDRNFNILNQKQDEIDILREDNTLIATELANWEEETRARLEAEIQTYRSILETQMRLLRGGVNLNYTTNNTYVSGYRDYAIRRKIYKNKLIFFI